MRNFLAVIACLAGLSLLATLSGCGGGGSAPNNTVLHVVISPSPVSLNQGDFVQVRAQVTGENDRIIVTQPVTFNLANGSISSAQISASGLICAGTWDSTTNPVVCTPTSDVGTMTLTATAGGVTSDPVTVYVHKRVTAVTVAPTPVPSGACLSQNATATFTATVKDAAGNDITDTVGPITFQGSNPSVATVDTTATPASPNKQKVFKAAVPGVTLVYASVSGVNSLSYALRTCSPVSIRIHVQSSTDTAFTLAKDATKTLVADMVDSKGTTLTNVPVVWSSSLRNVATVNTNGVVTGGSSPGVAYVSAGCVTPTCNIGLNQPMFSNLVAVTVTGTSASPSVYVASTATPTSGATNIVPLNTSTNAAGTPVAFSSGQVPNSMAFAGTGDLWIATNNGIVNLSPANNTLGTTLNTLRGKILGASPDGGRVVIYDSDNATVHVFNPTASNEIPLNISGVTAVSFTPDGGTIYIVAGNDLWVLTPALSSVPTQVPLGSTADHVAILASGQFAYITETAGFEVYATCNRALADAQAATHPTLISSLPDASEMVAADGTHVWGIGVVWSFSTTDCQPSLTDTWTSHPVAAFTARQIIVTPDSKHVYITNNTNNLLHYDATANTVSTIAIGSATFTGGATVDSSKVYVGAADGKVHVINVSSSSDSAQITVNNICTGSCLPDLVAVQPK